MKDRIKTIRKQFKETQQTFGDNLNVSKSTIEAIEYGKRDATDRIISDICRVYGINEEWLRTGSGEMFVPLTKEKEIAQIVKKMYSDEIPPEIAELIKLLTDMSEEETELFSKIIQRYVNALEQKKNLPEE